MVLSQGHKQPVTSLCWQPLQRDLENHEYVVDSCLRLHNFIIDEREEEKDLEMGWNRRGFVNEFDEEAELNVASDIFMRLNPFETIGVLALYDEQQRSRGRPTNAETLMRSKGKKLREEICVQLADAGLARPSHNVHARNDRHCRSVIY